MKKKLLSFSIEYEGIRVGAQVILYNADVKKILTENPRPEPFFSIILTILPASPN